MVSGMRRIWPPRVTYVYLTGCNIFFLNLLHIGFANLKVGINIVTK